MVRRWAPYFTRATYALYVARGRIFASSTSRRSARSGFGKIVVGSPSDRRHQDGEVCQVDPEFVVQLRQVTVGGLTRFYRRKRRQSSGCGHAR